MWRAVLVVSMAACGFTRGAATSDGPIADDRLSDIAQSDILVSPARMKVITIPGASVVGTQAAFPVWIAIDGDADLQARALVDGSDLYFTLPDHALLPFEIQSWSKPAGHLEAWVKLDVTSASATTFDLRYGDASVAQPANPAGVFSSSFLAVWHLDDTLAATAVAETLGKAPGTAAGSLGPAGHVTGKLGHGIAFDGVANEITFTDPWSSANNQLSHTLSTWVNVSAPTSGFSSILTVGNSTAEQSRWFHTHYTDLSCGFYGNDWTPSGVSIDGVGWKLVHFVYDSTTRGGKLYVNGALAATKPSPFSTGVATQGAGGHIGNAPMAWGPGGNTTNPLKGTLDELRIATTARGDGWIATEYANQSSPATFYSIGADQPAQ